MSAPDSSELARHLSCGGHFGGNAAETFCDRTHAMARLLNELTKAERDNEPQVGNSRVSDEVDLFREKTIR